MNKTPALQRGLEIIKKATTGDYTIQRLENETGIPKASFGRLLRCLSDNGFIAIDQQSKIVTTGDELLFSAMDSYERSPVYIETRGMLARLGAQWSQTFVIHKYREPFTAVWIAKTIPNGAINTRPIGFSMQGLNANAQGQYFLSQLPHRMVEEFFEKGLKRVHSAHTITDPETMKIRLADIREKGYVYIERENSPMMKQLAVPLKLRGEQGIFCLTCYMPLEFDSVTNLRDCMLFEAGRLTGIE
jgi:IclR family acetate operon transcriptional repressor